MFRTGYAVVMPTSGSSVPGRASGSDEACDDDPGVGGAGFSALYDRYAGQLHRYAFQRVGAQHAEDLVAETFLAAFAQRSSYDADRAEVRPWLFGILVRKLARHHRAEMQRYRAFARSAPEPSAVDGPADRVAARVAAGAMRTPLVRALSRLSSGDRDVLLLIAWGELTYEEVSRALDIPVGTVRSRLNRARRQVREVIGDADPTSDRQVQE
jgi:RNA polymerase sigma factor (sigma-70 family)